MSQIHPLTSYDKELSLEAQKHSKESLYEAYLIEERANKKSQEHFNNLQRDYKSIEFQRDYYHKAYYRQHFLHEIAMEDYDGQTVQEQIDVFFNSDWYIYETKSGGYYAMTHEKEKGFYNIFAAWHNPKKWRQEVKDMSELIQDIYNAADKPIYFSHSSYYKNVIANHSVEVQEGVFQLIMNEQDMKAFMEHFIPFDTKEKE